MKFVWPVPMVLFRALYFAYSIGRSLFPVAAILFFMIRYASMSSRRFFALLRHGTAECVWRDPISEITRAEANPKVA